jgi:hypothetical protein
MYNKNNLLLTIYLLGGYLMHNNNCNRLCIGSFAFAGGFVWGLGLFLLGLVNIWCQWAGEWVTFFSHGYVGYEATFVGALIGGAWGFLDAFIGCMIFAWIYNKSSKCCKMCCKGKCSAPAE